MKKNQYNVIQYCLLVWVMLFMSDSYAMTWHSPADSSDVRLTIIYPEAAKGDKLSFKISTHTPISLLSGDNEFREFTVAAGDDHIYHFSAALSPEQKKNGLYIVITDLNNTNPGFNEASKTTVLSEASILDHYFIENNDDLTITLKKKRDKLLRGASSLENFMMSFNGDGSKKLYARFQLDSLMKAGNYVYDYCSPDTTYNANNGFVKRAEQLASYLKGLTGKIDSQALAELRLHALFSMKKIEALYVNTGFKNRYKSASDNCRSRFCQLYDLNDTLAWSSFNRGALYNSYDFWAAEVQKYRTMGDIKARKSMSDSALTDLNNIKDLYIRERMFLIYGTYYLGALHDPERFMKAAFNKQVSQRSEAQLLDLLRMNTGAPAFDFLLTDVKGKIVKLSDFKEKVVFIDFWYTGCGGCLGYYQTVLSKVEEKFRSDPDVVFITVSIDKNFDLWKKSVKSAKYTSPLITNLYTNGKGMANDAIKFYEVHDFPRPLIVDKKQQIFKMGEELRNEKMLIDALNAASLN